MISLKQSNGTAGDDNPNIIKMPPMKGEPDPRGIGWYCYEKMTLYKDKIGQICTETGIEDTFGAFLKRSIRVAIKMSKIGITSSDIVSLCTYNHLNSMVPAIAAQFLCAKVASFDPTLSQEDTTNLMKQIKPKIIFLESCALKLIEIALRDAECNTKIVIFDDKPSKYLSFDEFLEECLLEEQRFRPVAAKSVHDTAYIFFSSGTTGFPKGICCPHYGLLAQSMHPTICKLLKGRVLGFASPYWISSIMILLVNLASGGTRIVMPPLLPENVWSTISKYKVKVMFGALNQIYDILHVRPQVCDVSSLEAILVGGTSISKEQIIHIRKEFPDAVVCQGYGQTEVCGCSTLIEPDFGEDILTKKAASCGFPLDGIFYKIVDVDTGEIVGPNKPGELWIKTKFQMNGYYNLDSSDCWDKDGYMRTGDVLYYDEDKFFYHVDRVKEMFKYKSWQVQPAVIEAVIAQHPAVLKTVVIGVPHPLDGDHPMAIVMVKNGFESTTPEEIKLFTNERVHDRQQLRGGLKIIKQMPLTASGKLNRRQIKELVSKNEI